MKKEFLITLLLSLLILPSCNRGEISLREALAMSGENRNELKKVLRHYKKEFPDKQKYEAACFLIRNMPLHYSYEPYSYREYCDSMIAVFTAGYDSDMMVRRANEVNESLRPNLRKVFDINYLTSEYLIDDIDRAFEIWHDSPYLQHLSFEQMCEFVLPYKCFDGQPCDDWREYAALPEDSELMQMQQIHEYKHVPRAAAEIVSRSLQPLVKGRVFSIDGLDAIPSFDYKLLSVIPFSTCQDFTGLDVIAQRASGVPVCTDITPNWPYMERPHYWNVVMNRNRLEIDYLALETLPGDWHYEDNRMAKAFRRTFSVNPELLKALRRGEKLPHPFNKEMFVKDVTTHYSNVLDLKVKLKKRIFCRRLVYLAVFDNEKWTAVDFGYAFGKMAHFKNVGFDNAYIVGICDDNGNLVPVSEPFVFDCYGYIKYCVAQKNVRTISLTRQYIALWHIWRARERLRGGAIESSDFPDFSKVASRSLFPQDDILSVETEMEDSRAHRYWRFVTTKEDSTCVGDLFFFVDGEIMDPKVFSSKDCDKWERVLDKDALSYSTIAKGGYIGFDFGRDVQVDKVSCIRRGDGNDIFPGDVYELYVWMDDNWKLFESKTAQDRSISFDGIPEGALYFIKCVSRGYQNRIFLYEEGNAIWY